MEPEFWNQRWAEGRIGFHQTEINAQLIRFFPALEIAERAPVFVPLCGKSEDLLWLEAQGHRVVGVDVAVQARDDFLTDYDRQTDGTGSAGSLDWIDTGGIRFHTGDFFQLQRRHIEGARAFYDRAALIALPPKMRPRYVNHLHQLLASGARGLVLVIEYSGGQMAGPPFSISDNELRGLFAEWGSLELLSEAALPLREKFTEHGVKTLVERVYRIER